MLPIHMGAGADFHTEGYGGATHLVSSTCRGELHLAPSQKLRGLWTLLDVDGKHSHHGKAELTERVNLWLWNWGFGGVETLHVRSMVSSSIAGLCS